MEARQAQNDISLPRQLRRRSGKRAAAMLLAAVGLVPMVLSPWGLREVAGNVDALSLIKKEKVLFEKNGYELRVKPRKTKNPVGQVIPKVIFQKVPAARLSLSGVDFSVDSDLDKEIMGFPFTTSNMGSLSIGLPRMGGVLKLSAEDPPISAEVEDAQKAAQVAYEQALPGIGDVGLNVKTSGEWGATWNRKVEDLGYMRGTLNSQLDWSVDLDTTYPAYKDKEARNWVSAVKKVRANWKDHDISLMELMGITPSVSYGATQDGMRVKAKIDTDPVQNSHLTYEVQNMPGKYAPIDFVHDATLTVKAGRQTLEAKGSYDRRYPKMPVRGSLTAIATTGPLAMEASVDFDRYRLKASAGPAEVSAAVGKLKEATGTGYLGGRPTELELRLGKVAAQAKLHGDKKPRVRMEVAI